MMVGDVYESHTAAWHQAYITLEKGTCSRCAPTATYAYDEAGKLDYAQYPTGTGLKADFSYDAADRLKIVENFQASPLTTISKFTYDLDGNGNRTRMTDASSAMTDYKYDKLNRLTRVDYPAVTGQPTRADYGYDAVGNRTSMQLDLGTATTYQFDEVDQLKQISTEPDENKFDQAGSLVAIDSNNRFVYDLQGRLIRTGRCTGDVNGDGVVNSGDQGGTATHFGTIGNADGKYDVLHDIAGSDGIINSGDVGLQGSQFSKQCKNQAGPGTGNGRSWYNGDGLRVRERSWPGGTLEDHEFVWDAGAGLPVILQDTKVGGTSTLYVYGLDLISATDGAGATTYYMTDGLGSTTDVRTSSGAASASYVYDVFGALRATTGAAGQEFRFTGEQQDVHVNRGLVYLRARHYDPTLGRFLGKDPLPLGNRYVYSHNNPVNYSDPSGLWPNIDTIRDLVQGSKEGRGMETPTAVPTATATPTPRPSMCVPAKPGDAFWEEVCGFSDCQSKEYMHNRAARCIPEPADCTYNSRYSCQPSHYGDSDFDVSAGVNFGIAKLVDWIEKQFCRKGLCFFNPLATPNPNQ
jgi:RHS repeat-associated protein